MLTSLPNVLLAIAGLLIVISAVQPLARRLALSETVLLALVGILIGVGSAFLIETKATDALDDVASTLLYFPIDAEGFLVIFLPILVFHGALTIEARRLARDAAPVLVLAVVAVVVTTAAIGFALYPIGGVSLVACLMLGAIVATTDPSAVVAVFREIGADGRLTRLVEGESLLNDAAAISIFTILLEQLTRHHGADFGHAALLLGTSFGGGLLIGFVLARLMLFAVPLLGGSRAAEMTLTLALPYVAYILCDEFLGYSGVVAAATAGLTLSAIGPSTFRPQSWRFLQDVWTQLAFWASSLVFILASILVPKLLLGMRLFDFVLLVVVVLAALAARAAVLFGMLPVLNAAKLSQKVPTPFKLTMLWGGLRGAITLALALAVTENRHIPAEVQHFVAVLATGFVLFTLLVAGTTLPALVRRLGLDRLSPIDQALRSQVVAIGLGVVGGRIRETADEFGFTPGATQHVTTDYERRSSQAMAANTFDEAIADRDRVVLGLISFASQERTLLLGIFRDRTIPRRLMEGLLRSVDAMIDAARSDGRFGYLRAVRRRLQPSWRFRAAHALHRFLRIDPPLMHCMMERFETLLVMHLVFTSMDRFLHERMDAVLGKRVADIVGEITHRRQEYLEAAIDTLRVQYPGYAEALERRMLRRIGVRFEEREYTRLREESLIGEELYDQIMRELAERRDHMSQRLRFNLQTGLDRRVRELPVFAGLEQATLHDLSMRLTMRFAAPGEKLVRPRRRVRSIFFISAGTVEIKAGDETFRLRDGEFFGVDDVLNARRSTIGARAINFTNLLELRRRDFERILADNPTLGERIAQVVSQQRADRAAAARAEAETQAAQPAPAGPEAEVSAAEERPPYPLPRPHVVH